jgi:AraC family transcriptional regulator
MLSVHPEFRAEETHGFESVTEVEVTASSAGLGWSAMYVSSQAQAPHKATFAGKPVILVSALDVGPVRACVGLGDTTHCFRAGSGAVSIIPDRQDVTVDLATSAKSTHVFVRRSLLEEVAGSLNGSDPADLAITARLGTFDPFLQRICNEARESLAAPDAMTATYVDYLARMLCAYLVRKYSTASQPLLSEREGKLSPRVIARIREFTEAHLDERCSVKDIADEVGMGPDHLGRLFKNTTGMTLYQFVIRCRVDLAQKLLSESAMPIATIALECGFSDQVSLTRTFKKVIGLTPAVFRAQDEDVIVTAQTRRRR